MTKQNGLEEFVRKMDAISAYSKASARANSDLPAKSIDQADESLKKYSGTFASRIREEYKIDMPKDGNPGMIENICRMGVGLYQRDTTGAIADDLEGLIRGLSPAGLDSLLLNPKVAKSVDDDFMNVYGPLAMVKSIVNDLRDNKPINKSQRETLAAVAASARVEESTASFARYDKKFVRSVAALCGEVARHNIMLGDRKTLSEVANSALKIYDANLGKYLAGRKSELPEVLTSALQGYLGDSEDYAGVKGMIYGAAKLK